MCAGLAVLMPTAHADRSPHVNYMLECQGCHLADGTGAEPEVPSLVGRIGRYLSVDGGREYLIQVPGVSQAALSDRELARVLNWILQTFSADTVPANFEPYTAEEVGRFRPNAPVDIIGARDDLLSALGEDATAAY